MYTAWVNGASTTDDANCITAGSSPCNKHYRNSSIDNWPDLNVKSVSNLTAT